MEVRLRNSAEYDEISVGKINGSEQKDPKRYEDAQPASQPRSGLSLFRLCEARAGSGVLWRPLNGVDAGRYLGATLGQHAPPLVAARVWAVVLSADVVAQVTRGVEFGLGISVRVVLANDL